MERPELTLELAKKADYFLKELLDKDGIDVLNVLPFFNSKDEAFFIVKYLEELGIVNLVGPTYSAPFSLITANGGIGMILEMGGLAKRFQNKITNAKNTMNEKN